jgi:general secretion pathway protein D
VIAILVVFVAAVTDLHAQEPVRVTEQGVMLDFQDADLRLVISALAEAGALNVMYGELPARKVTLRTTQPVPTQQILTLLRSVARANGLEMVDDSGFVRLDAGAPPDARAVAQAQEEQEEFRLYVHRLNHARANRLAATLQSLLGGARTAGAGSTSLRPSLSQSLRDQRIPPLEEREQAAEQEPDPAQGGSIRAELRGDIQIVPDEATNALLVRAQPSDWAVIQEAIQALDLRPLQVLIEVVIAEVRRSRNLDIGIAASVSNTDGSRTTEAELQGGGQDQFALRLMRSGKVDIDVALSALSATGDVRILSRPVVLAQNNQEARILVGAERPFVQVFRSLPTDGAIRDQVVQYRDVGTALTILPTINPDGYVNLQITQEVSTATSETQFGAPVISTREAMTHLLARNGQTVVIGGLIDRQTDYARTGIPLLMSIPIVGGLFGTTRTMEGNSELFLFLTPYVVETDEDADRIREGVEDRTELLRRLAPIGPLILPRPDTIRGGGR